MSKVMLTLTDSPIFIIGNKMPSRNNKCNASTELYSYFVVRFSLTSLIVFNYSLYKLLSSFSLLVYFFFFYYCFVPFCPSISSSVVFLNFSFCNAYDVVYCVFVLTYYARVCYIFCCYAEFTVNDFVDAATVVEEEEDNNTYSLFPFYWLCYYWLCLYCYYYFTSAFCAISLFVPLTSCSSCAEYSQLFFAPYLLSVVVVVVLIV